MGSTLETEHLESIAAIITIGLHFREQAAVIKSLFQTKMVFIKSFYLEMDVKRRKLGLRVRQHAGLQMGGLAHGLRV